jgi:hypothetical protein
MSVRVGNCGPWRARGDIHGRDGGVSNGVIVGIEHGTADGSGGSVLRAQRDGEDQGGDGDSNPGKAAQS